jgi:TIR domain-containing protein
MPYDTFISYSRVDQPFVRVFDEFLREAGINPWYDERCLRPGKKWEEVIEDEIPNSRTFITCISTAGMQKAGYFHAEQNLAANRALRIPPNQLFILPVTLGECEIPRMFRQYHVVNLHEPGAIESLLLSFGEALGRPISATADRTDALRNALRAHLGVEAASNAEILERFLNDVMLSFQDSMGLIEQIANSSDPKRLQYLLRLRSCDYISYAEQAALDLAIEAVKSGQRISGLQQTVRDAEWARISQMGLPGDPAATQLLRVNKYARYVSRKNSDAYVKAESYIHDMIGDAQRLYRNDG